MRSSGNRHATSGSDGTGPSPCQLRVGDPRNVSTPSTASPHGLPTDSGSTQPVNGGSVVVVVVVVVEVAAASVVEGAAVVAGGGAVVVAEASNSRSASSRP